MNRQEFIQAYLPESGTAGVKHLEAIDARVHSPSALLGAVSNAAARLALDGTAAETVDAAVNDVLAAITAPGPGGRDLLGSLLLLTAAEVAVRATSADEAADAQVTQTEEAEPQEPTIEADVVETTAGGGDA